MEKTLAELAEYVGGRVIGDPDAAITGLGALESAGEREITFLANPKYASKVSTTKAAAVVLPPGANGYGRNVIECANPYLAFAKLLTLFNVKPHPPLGVMDGAHIAKDVLIGDKSTVFPNAVILDGVKLGDRVVIFPGVVLYPGVEVGDDVVIHANVTIRERCRIGNRVIIHSGTVIGSDGFGYVPDGKEWYKIPQIGIVMLEDDVEIGANVTIDRAALDVTLIRKGTKIDNLVQIAHNCIIGENCAIAAMAGIAGSAKLGDHVIIGGQAAVAGHLEIGNDVMVGGMSGVHGNIPAGSIISGIPAYNHRDWLRVSAIVPRLPELKKTVSALEKRVEELEKKLKEVQNVA